MCIVYTVILYTHSQLNDATLIIMRRARRHSSGKNVSATQSTTAIRSADTTASTTDGASTADTTRVKAALNPMAPLSKHRPAKATAAISNSDDEGAVNSGKMDSIKSTASKHRSNTTETTAVTSAAIAASSYSRGRAVHNTIDDSTNSTAALKHSHNQHHQQQLNDNDDDNSLGLSSDQSMTESESDD
jgi:hypothetical protein